MTCFYYRTPQNFTTSGRCVSMLALAYKLHSSEAVLLKFNDEMLTCCRCYKKGQELLKSQGC